MRQQCFVGALVAGHVPVGEAVHTRQTCLRRDAHRLLQVRRVSVGVEADLIEATWR